VGHAYPALTGRTQAFSAGGDKSRVERRKEPRLAPAESIQVTVLGGEHAPMTGTVIDQSRQGLSLRLPGPVAPDAAIQVEAGDIILLGEVRYCQPAEGGYRVGLTIRHRLSNLERLRAWSRQLRGEDTPVPVIRS
jgi:hypothetical protein